MLRTNLFQHGAAVCAYFPDLPLIAVARGITGRDEGHRRAQEASSLIIQAVQRYFSCGLNIGESLRRAGVDFQLKCQRGSCDVQIVACVAAVGDRWEIAQIGNVQAVLVRQGCPKQLLEPQSAARAECDGKKVGECGEPWMEHVATHALGLGEREAEILAVDTTAESGDCLVIAARPLTSDELARLVVSKLDVLKDELVNHYNGGISVVTAEIG